MAHVQRGGSARGDGCDRQEEGFLGSGKLWGESGRKNVSDKRSRSQAHSSGRGKAIGDFPEKGALRPSNRHAKRGPGKERVGRAG